MTTTTTTNFLGTLTADSAGKLDVLGHDGDTLGVDGAQVGVFEESYEVGFGSFLEGHDSRALETEIGFEVLGDFTDQALEGKLADEELSALLVTTDLTESHGTGPVPVGLLDASGGGGALASGLGGQLLPRGLASGRLTGGLLGTSHVNGSDETDGAFPPTLFIYSLQRRAHTHRHTIQTGARTQTRKGPAKKLVQD